MDIETFDWNKYLREALNRTEFMALSTIGSDGSWVCPVQFSYDEKLVLYFKSMPTSKHMQNISNNGNVSVAIFSTNRLADDDVAGIQARGNATILHDCEEVELAAKYHYTRKNLDADYKKRVDEHLGENAEWNFVKIVLQEAWYFDTRFFDETRQEIPKSLY